MANVKTRTEIRQDKAASHDGERAEQREVETCQPYVSKALDAEKVAIVRSSLVRNRKTYTSLANR